MFQETGPGTLSWCPGPDLNWHDPMKGPRILSPVRLPISPPGHLFAQIELRRHESDFEARLCQSLRLCITTYGGLVF